MIIKSQVAHYRIALHAIVLLLLINTHLLNADSCYAVQIWSQKGVVERRLSSSTGACRLYSVGGYTASRCGCFERVDDAKKSLAKYIQRYPTAYVIKISKSDMLKSSLGFSSKGDTSYSGELASNFKQLDIGDDAIYGLTIEGKYEEFTNRNYRQNDGEDVAIRNYVDYQGYVKLNFSLFKDGFFEYKSSQKRERKRSKLLYLQNLSSVLKNSFSDMKIFLKKLGSQVEYRYYRELANLYRDSMVGYRDRYQNSMIEKYKYSLIKQRYRRYARYATLYKRHNKLTLTKDIYRLLKRIDHLSLVNRKLINRYAMEHSSSLRLLEAKSSILNETPRYLDAIEVDLYAKKNSIDEVGSYDTLGIEVKVPLDMSISEEQRVARLRRASDAIVSRSFEHTIEQRISQLYMTFVDMQKFVDIDRDDILYFRSRIKLFKKLKVDMIDEVSVDPDREILNASHKIVDRKFNILKTKIKLIAILYEIGFISGTEDISLLIKSGNVR